MSAARLIAPRLIAPRLIAVVRSDAGHGVQDLLAAFAARHRGQWRLSGVVETGPADHRGSRRLLSNIASERTYPLFQDLGRASTACALRAEGLVSACRDVCDGIEAGCDLVVLSKFGKLEAEGRTGLTDAFAAALAADLPVITSVATRFEEAWSRFAAPLFEVLPARPEALEDWWNAVRARAA